MSKRSLEESRAGARMSTDPDNNGLMPIQDLLSPGEEEHGQSSGPSKKPRNFIATVSLRSQMSPPTHEPQTQLSPAFGGNANQPLSMLPPIGDNFTPAAAGDGDDFEFEENQTKSDSAGRISISFSQHGVIVWPGARQILPKQLLAAYEMLGKNYVIELESTRPPLPMFASPYPLQAGDHWLEVLPLAMIRGLADAFFSVFNPSTPIMDKGFFFSFTLGSAIESGFGSNLESCLVLNVLALGCLAVRAYQEGNYPLPGTQGHRFEPPEWMNVVYEEQPGLRFFNEARRRIGFLMCDNDIQSCQFYLLSSVYYSQIPRPMDSWTMISRAATCCLSMLTNHNVNFDEWEGDMKSRVYWNCLMNETILVQELHLPSSGLSRLEEQVPIPKFIGFETTGYASTRFNSSGVVDDSYFQYHFLAQVAHRIILTRIRHSLYFYSDSGTFPLPAINTELHHQLEQWRTNLPTTIQFNNAPYSSHPTPATPSIHPSPSASIASPAHLSSPRPRHTDPNQPLSPAIAVTDAMLKGRHMIARFHIGRPYLYKALRIPHLLTDEDFVQVQSGLQNAMDWPITQGIFRKMKSCIPIKFAFCSQFFGQILLFYCIAHSPSARLRETLPDGWEHWNEEMLGFLEDCAPHSPAVAQDLELLRYLWPEN
ncbi:Transcription factor, fungi [Penicillium expansum]|uniref:Transcription factor, fungi n=1 Tax=Penicillium expansum TaxID=27334 RepID=A0A0A2JP98_PENEN|nr:Transcription factor, fungi [Penicillium expansum]KGO45517.1 Transcription factor, fungi [Penicillium expansum]KGO56102.1 Transcription factor, fungi [Penicillium expansum]KGO57252.1 Transcription factor, fungi [Penicillium expansum]